MYPLLFSSTLVILLLTISCQPEELPLPCEHTEAAIPSRLCTAYAQIDPLSNEGYIGSDAVQLAYSDDFASFRSRHPLSNLRVYTPADCGEATVSVKYAQEYNYYTCEAIFHQEFIDCNREERGPDGFYMTINYDCAVDSRTASPLNTFGGWKHFIDSIGSKLDGMIINGHYLNIEGTPALGVLYVPHCYEQSLYLDWIPHSNEPEEFKQQNYMSNCTGIFQAQLDDGVHFEFHHQTERSIYPQPLIFMSGDVLQLAADYVLSPNGESITAALSSDILAAVDSTGYLFFALGHE